MTKSYSTAVLGMFAVLALSFIAVSPAFAAVVVQDNIVPLVNGKTSAEVRAGQDFDFTFTVDATNGDEVEYVRSRVEDQNGAVIFNRCENVGRVTGNDVEVEVELATPGDTPNGNIDIIVDVFGMPGVSQNDGCEGTSLDGNTYEDIARVGDNTNVGHGSEVGSGGTVSSLESMIKSLTAAVQALIANQTKPSDKPACPPVGSTSTVQAWLMANGYAAGFHAAGVYSPTGYWGPITANAHAQAMAACK